MKLDFDVSALEYTVIRDILARVLPPDSNVWVFGSRAKGTARFNSDLDLAIDGKAAFSRSQIYALKEAFDDAPLSFRIDIVDLAEVDAGFRKIIEGHRVSFPMLKARQKKLRFPEFSGEWEDTTLGGLIQTLDAGVSVNSGDRPARSDEKGVLKTSCVTLGNFDHCENKVVADEIEIERLKEPVQANSVIISRMNTPAMVGASAIVPVDFPNLFLPDRLWAAKVKVTASPNWIALLLAHHKTRERLSDRATGTSGSMKNLTKTDVLSLRVYAPSLAEQKKIAAFLGVVDARIAALRAKVSGLETYKRGLMQALFSQTLRFTKSDGTNFPDWEEKKLGEVFEVTRGNVLAMPETSPIPTLEKPFPVYSSQTKNGGLAGYYQDYLYEDAITWTTDGANAGDTRFRSGKFFCTNVCGVLLNSEGYANTFVAEMINLISAKYVSYVGNPKLMNGVMASIKLPFPHPDEQQKIADALSAMDAKIQAVSAQVSHMETFKKGLLQQMFV